MKNLALALSLLFVSLHAEGAAMFRNPLPVATRVGDFTVMEPGDFNGDGHADLLTIEAYPSGTDHPNHRYVSVVLANGTGPFAAPVRTLVPRDLSADHAAIGDLNEDGRSDVVLVNQVADSIHVYFGNVDGTLTPGPSASLGTFLYGAVALADFNGDQNLDVVTAVYLPESGQQRVAVHFGNGSGSFSGTVLTNVDEQTRGLETFDINADGKADLLVQSDFTNDVYLGNGNGGFTWKAAAIDGPAVARDFNHDGKLDLAVADPDQHAWFAQLWFGTGDGSLTAGAKYDCGFQAGGIDSADVDGDGNFDLLIVAPGGSVTVLRGNADGTFDTPEAWAAGVEPTEIVAADFDRDGNLDFVTSNRDTMFEGMAFVHGNGDGTFRTPRIHHVASPLPVPWPGPRPLGGILAAMNGDLDLDVVVSMDDPQTRLRDIAVLLNDGTGRLAAPLLVPTGWDDITFAAGDVTGDGKQDVVVASRQHPSHPAMTLPGNGNGTFGSPATFNVIYAESILLGQFAGDASLDLLVASWNEVSVYPGNGNGTFGAGIATYIGGSGSEAVPGDLNGDGKLDFVVRNRAFLSLGDGHFSEHATNADYDGNGFLALADMNGDDKLDILAQRTSAIETHLGNGNGTFSAPIAFPVILNSTWDKPVTVADFDGDGLMDLSTVGDVLLGNGDGRFRMRVRALTPIALAGASSGDMDGNGSPDLVTVQAEAADVAVFLTRTSPDPTAPSSVTLTSDQATAQYGVPVPFHATVTGGVVPLTGAVTFSVDGVPAGIVIVDEDGKASLALPLAAGAHTITATYAGDENYASSSQSISQPVVKATPYAKIAGAPNPQQSGLNVTISVQLRASGDLPAGFVAPSGAPTFRDGNAPLALQVTNGTATINTLTVGAHEISLDYAGDANYQPVTVSYTQIITHPIPTLTLTTAQAENQLFAGQPVTFRAALAEDANATGGTVSFYVNNVLRGVSPMHQGVAELQLTLPWGDPNVKAVFSGNDSWTNAEIVKKFTILIGPWGTPLSVDATGFGNGAVSVVWSKVSGGVSYTLWVKKSIGASWEVKGTFSPNVALLSTTMPVNTTWMFALTATDANNNVSALGPPDLATTVPFTDPVLSNNVTRIKAAHFNELRTAIGAVRTFAGLGAFSYTNAILAGQPVRADDLQQMRTALGQARTAIQIPAIAFEDSPVVAGSTKVRAMHIGQLRAGTN